MKRLIKSNLIRFLESDTAKRIRNRELQEYRDLRKELTFYPDAYSPEPLPTQSQAHQKPPVFITGRFRSGSTMLWSIFRQVDGCTAYYEPFNERRWFDATTRGARVDRTHRGVDEYWREYDGLEGLQHYYREEWIKNRLLMRFDDFDYSMKKYITEIAGHRPGYAILQFNRVDFRLPWLKCNFPDSEIIHIYRNPRDQWCSFLYGQTNYGPDQTGSVGFEDHFYLRLWYHDLVRNFPFLAHYEKRHQYYLFFLLWKLSYCFGKHYSTISLSMEELSHDPYYWMNRMFEKIGIEDNAKALDLSFVDPQTSRWESYATSAWFERIEKECNEVIQDFLSLD